MTKYKYYVGIDPGSQGGIAIIGPRNKVRCYSFEKDPRETAKHVARIPEGAKVVFENVHAIYGSAASATFSFGRNLGIMEGLVAGRGHTWDTVTPKVWQAYIDLTPRKKEGRKYVESSRQWKVRLNEEAKKLYPTCEAWNETMTYQLAVTDAILIAHFLKNNDNE